MGERYQQDGALAALLLEGWTDALDGKRTLDEAATLVRKAIYGTGVGRRLTTARAWDLDKEDLEQDAARKYMNLLHRAAEEHEPSVRALQDDGKVIVSLRRALEDWFRAGGREQRSRKRLASGELARWSRATLEPGYVARELEELLPARRQEVLVRLLNGRSQTEIARDLGISQSTVSRERARVLAVLVEARLWIWAARVRAAGRYRLARRYYLRPRGRRRAAA